MTRIENDFTILSGLTLLLRNWRTIVFWPAIGLGIALFVIITADREYEAESSFMQSSLDGGSSRLAGLAASFGNSLAIGGGSLGPDFYASVLRTKDLLQDVATSTYLAPGSDNSEGTLQEQTLVEIYAPRGTTDDSRLRSVVKQLEKQISVRVNLRSNLITLTTTSISR